jgi:hypothetical protein
MFQPSPWINDIANNYTFEYQKDTVLEHTKDFHDNE